MFNLQISSDHPSWHVQSRFKEWHDNVSQTGTCSPSPTMGPLHSFSVLIIAHPLTWYHIPNGLHYSQHFCNNKKIWNSNCRILIVQLHLLSLTVMVFTINNINRENYFHSLLLSEVHNGLSERCTHFHENLNCCLTVSYSLLYMESFKMCTHS